MDLHLALSWRLSVLNLDPSPPPPPLPPQRLIALKKQNVRIMSRSVFDAHTDPLFKKLGILNLDRSIYKLQIGNFYVSIQIRLTY